MLLCLVPDNTYTNKIICPDYPQIQYVVGPELKLFPFSIKPILVFNMLYIFKLKEILNKNFYIFPVTVKKKYFSEIRYIFEVIQF